MKSQTKCTNTLSIDNYTFFTRNILQFIFCQMYQQSVNKKALITITWKTHSAVEMWQRQINILCMIWQDCADLKMRSSFYAWWRFERKDSLKTLDAVLDVRRVRRSEMFRQSKQCCIPRIWLLLSNGHRHRHVLNARHNVAYRHTAHISIQKLSLWQYEPYVVYIIHW